MLCNITLHIEDDYTAMSQKAADIFAASVRGNPAGAYGFATGDTPIGMYKILIDFHLKGCLDLSGINAYNLDEYHPISKNNPNSYYYFMRKNLYDAVGLPPTSTFIPCGEAADPLKECMEYDEKITSTGGIDIQILGIGTNGHIGFNEPDDKLNAATHYVPLAEATIQSNAKNFGSLHEMPRHALTMGMHGIMMAKCILLLASGEKKARILNQALLGPITTQVPASFLQLHQNVIVVADKDAAGLLKLV